MTTERYACDSFRALPQTASLFLGITTSAMLFWVMQALVSVPNVIPEAVVTPKVMMHRLIKDKPPVPKPPEPIVKPSLPPAMPEVPFAPGPISDDGIYAMQPAVDIDARTIVDQIAGIQGAAGGRGGPVPVVRVDPEYPARALRSGTEGYVDLQFRVTAAGTVADVEVLSADPPHTFEQAAKRAVRKWRYTPVAGGGSSDRDGTLRIRLEFELP